MDNYKKLIGNRIRALREMRGLSTQQALADALSREMNDHTDVSRVSRWETGEFKPSPKYRKPLCKILSTTEDEIFKVNPDAKIEPAETKHPLSTEEAIAKMSKEIADKVTANIQLPSSPIIREILGVLSTFNEQQLGQVLAGIEAIRNSAARAAASNKKKIVG